MPGRGRTTRLCSLILWAYVVIYLFAIAVFLIGTLGWFGTEKDALAGMFVVLPGQPWTAFVDDLPRPLWPYAAVLAPVINLGLILPGCRLIRLVRPELPMVRSAPARGVCSLSRPDFASWRCRRWPTPLRHPCRAQSRLCPRPFPPPRQARPANRGQCR